jgi:hypothetical protein
MLEKTVDTAPRLNTVYGRFAALMSSDHGDRLPCDEVLLEIDRCVVAPTLGSILPYWLLIIPRAASVNFVRWRSEIDIEPYQLVAELLAKRNIDSKRAIWFEHGPVSRGSAVACGVDHAHIHVVIDAPFSFDAFISASKNESHLTWRETASNTAYSSIVETSSYLFASSMDRAVVTKDVESVGSQFFRRVIAGLIGLPEAWNYRSHPYHENVRKTLDAFGSL